MGRFEVIRITTPAYVVGMRNRKNDTNTYLHTSSMYTYVHTYVYTYIYAYMHVSMQAYIYTKRLTASQPVMHV